MRPLFTPAVGSDFWFCMGCRAVVNWPGSGEWPVLSGRVLANCQAEKKQTTHVRVEVEN